MSCLVAILAVITPRIAMIGIWLTTHWFDRAFESVIWPVLGFFFAPYTTLAYMAAMIYNDGQMSGAWIGLLIIALLADISSSGNANRKRARGGRAGGGD